MSTKVFSTDAMNRIGNSDGQRSYFNFSSISSENYVSFFNTLPNYLLKRIDGVTFMNSKSDESVFEESIAAKNPKYIVYLVKILVTVLPMDNSLSALFFDSIDIPEHHQRSLFHAISKSKSLERIRFKNTSINQDIFCNFLSKITPYQFIEVSFTSCNISSLCYPSIIQFIERKPLNEQIYRKIRIFDVSGCNFTQDEMSRIGFLVKDAQKDENEIESEVSCSISSLGGSDKIIGRSIQASPVRIISSPTAKTLLLLDPSSKNSTPLYKMKSNPNSVQSKSLIDASILMRDLHKKQSSHLINDGRFQYQEKHYAPRPIPAIIKKSTEIVKSEDFSFSNKPSDQMSNQELSEEILRMRGELSRLMKKLSATKISDNVFVIGKGSKSFADTIKVSESKLTQINNM